MWDHRCQCSLRLNVFNLSESLFIPMINSNPDLATGYFTGYVTEFFTLYSQVRTTGFGPEHTQGAFVSSNSHCTNFPRGIMDEVILASAKGMGYSRRNTTTVTFAFIAWTSRGKLSGTSRTVTQSDLRRISASETSHHSFSVSTNCERGLVLQKCSSVQWLSYLELQSPCYLIAARELRSATRQARPG